jgi:glycosyltransferase involved in cell wall biosynthesis
MRIALANWTSRHAGGIETYVGRVAEAFTRQGHAALFLHERDEPVDRASIDGVGDLPHVSVAAVGVRSALDQLYAWQPDVVFVQRLNDPDLERALVGVAPSVYFAHDYLGLCISGLRTHQARQNSVCHERFDGRCLARFFPCRCGGRSPVTMWQDYRRQRAALERLRAYGQIACFSDYMRQLYLQHGFAADRVHRVSPIDTGSTMPHAGGRTPSRDCRLLFMGRIDRLKGCHVLIDALPTVAARTGHDVTLTIAGSGPYEAACRERADLATRHGRVRVQFLGWQSTRQCQALLRECDLLVMPSLWPEPLGLAGLEALRAGVPVTAFAVGAISEWLEDGVTGTLATTDPPTAHTLADAIVRCLASPDIRDGAARYARTPSSTPAHVTSLIDIFCRAADIWATASHPRVPALAAARAWQIREVR